MSYVQALNFDSSWKNFSRRFFFWNLTCTYLIHILISVCSFSFAHVRWKLSFMHIPFWYVHIWVMCKHQFYITVEKILVEGFFLKSYMHISHTHTDISLLLFLCSCRWKLSFMHIPIWYVHIWVMCKHQFLIPVEKILAEEFFLKSYMHIPHTHTDISLLFLLYYGSYPMKA